MTKRSIMRQAKRILEAGARQSQAHNNVQNPNRPPIPTVAPAPAVIASAPAPVPVAPAPSPAIAPVIQVAPQAVEIDTPNDPQPDPVQQPDAAPLSIATESTETEIKEEGVASPGAADCASPQSNANEGNGELSYPDSNSDLSIHSDVDSTSDFSDVDQPGLEFSDDDSDYLEVKDSDVIANSVEEQKAMDASQQPASLANSLMDSTNLPSLRDFIRNGLTFGFSRDSRSLPTINSNIEPKPNNNEDRKSPSLK